MTSKGKLSSLNDVILAAMLGILKLKNQGGTKDTKKHLNL